MSERSYYLPLLPLLSAVTTIVVIAASFLNGTFGARRSTERSDSWDRISKAIRVVAAQEEYVFRSTGRFAPLGNAQGPARVPDGVTVWVRIDSLPAPRVTIFGADPRTGERCTMERIVIRGDIIRFAGMLSCAHPLPVDSQ